MMGSTNLTNIAFELVKQVNEDLWFKKRGFFTNVDFWAGIIFDTLDFPVDMMPVWTVIPRYYLFALMNSVSGMVAHMIEFLDDPEYKIYRPRQVKIPILPKRYMLVKMRENMKALRL